jgi:hypothetical protein
VFVPPADEPHGAAHAKLAAVIDAHRGPDFAVAVDMLTRTSRIDDLAPDVSVYPAARNPQTGGRQLEQLAFEIASTESLGHAGSRAAKLVGRGVRRVFAIDVERARALEWSATLDAWSILDRRAEIVDPALAVPLPIEALLDAARADAAIPRAYRVQRHAEFVAEHEEGRAEGRAEALLVILISRGFAPSDRERRLIGDERDFERMSRWLAGAATCGSIAELLRL